MLIIPIKEGENIDRALKRFKRKFDRTGTKNQLRERKQIHKTFSKKKSSDSKSSVHPKSKRSRRGLAFLFDLTYKVP